MMPTTTCLAHSPREFSTLRQRALDTVVEDLLAAALSVDIERRESVRHPFTRPVELIPCDPTGNHRQQPILCVGKEISSQGFGFFHQEPLPHRYMLVSFAPTVEFPDLILVRMKRCRFLGENWYESGAQFVRVFHQSSVETQA